jgi:DNA-binding GntR family transcriptional regulator
LKTLQSRARVTRVGTSVDRTSDGALPDDTVVGQLTRQLVEAIVRGDLAPGEKLSEPELAQRWGTSRGSLREALHRLEGMRLVDRQPRRSARVATIGRSELAELYTVREALEGLASRLASDAMTAEEVADIRKLLLLHERRPDVMADTGYYQSADEDFHLRIARASRNSELVALLDGQLAHRVSLYRYRSSQMRRRPQRALREHHRILDAIEAGDGELAELLMRRHIRAARTSLEADIEGSVERSGD